MFNQKANTKALVKAQDEIENLMNDFEKKSFSAKSGNVEVVVLGDMSLKNAINEGDFSISDVLEANQQALSIAKKERSVGLAKIRNRILKQFKFDIKDLIPEIAKAVSHLNELQSAK